ncbi:hypothetical protein N7541_004773 [Penicillium brevicompactum]|uniref:NADH dehydrogenase [ubiquinone] 1 alpha subcomplex subunit 13 n=1 Tax=Penicillium brevicompactum TaxID=5074 RepID=A0A9W9RDQ0_PENBR|nr:hypothetical protein N7541_004773 [Penicillium brevicompactum]
MPQDMPPTGGLRSSPVQGMQFNSDSGPPMALRAQHTSTQTTYHSLQRNIPARGFKPAYYMIGMHVIMAYGFYKYFHGAREQRELAREKMWSRHHLTPLLQAEEDRDQVRRHYADKAREKELLGTDIKVYNSDRFVRPTFAYTPSNLTQ